MNTGESDLHNEYGNPEDNGNFKENKINFSKEVKQVIDKVSSILSGSELTSNIMYVL